MPLSPVPWNVIAVIVGAALTVASTMIFFMLRSLKTDLAKYGDRIDVHTDQIANMGATLATCKVDCHRQFASNEDFIRSQTHTRQMMEKIAASMASVEGSLKVTEQLPQIVGNVTRQVVKELNAQQRGPS